MACSAYVCVTVQLSDIGPHSYAAGAVTDARSASVPVAAPGPVKRPPNVKVKRAVTEPVSVVVTFVNGANVPSAAMVNRAVGRTEIPGLLSVPLGEQGMLRPKVMFVMARPSLVTSKLTGVPRDVMPA